MYGPAIVLFTTLCSFGILFAAIIGVWVLWARRHARFSKRNRHCRCRLVKPDSANDVSPHRVTQPIVYNAASSFYDNTVQIPLPLKIKKAPPINQQPV